MPEISQMDLYQLFDVQEDSSIKEITSAFRRKALTCHPDKFPNDKEKHELFLTIKEALGILTDEKAREKYDADRKQKKIHQERLSKMDDKRKKFKEDLERNERNATQMPTSAVNRATADQFKAEIERLRREGNRLVDEELEKLHTIVENDMKKMSINHVKIVIKFYPNTKTYTEDELKEIFGKYGDISTIVNMPSNQQALIEFNNDHISQFIENEKGLEGRPLASVKIKKQKKTKTDSSTVNRQNEVVDLTRPELEDLEAMVFRKMAQATNS